jgi:single-strand DNA-binding protein
MASVNKVILIGNVTRDPEVKYTPKGTAVAEVGLAVNRTWKDDGGQKKEEVTFIDVDLWGRTAEIAGEYLRKGASVYFEGRLKLESWEDKTSGQKRSKLKVVGEVMQFLGGKAEGGEQREQRPATQRPSAPPAAKRPQRDADLDPDGDDIPF